MGQAEEILDLWAERTRAHKIHAALEITAEGLVIGAGTLLAKAKADRNGRVRLRLDDEPRAMALLATGYERLIGVHVVARLRRACELWSEGEKALAHIHLAFAALPPCMPDEGLRIFAADRLIKKGVTPIALMKAQGFEPLALAYNEAELRDRGGRWTTGGGAGVNVAVGSEDNDKDRIERERRLRGQETPKDAIEHGRGIPLFPEGPLGLPPPSSGALEPGPATEVDLNKLHHIFRKVRHDLDSFVSEFGSEERAFRAIEAATRQAVKGQKITGEYKIQIDVGGHRIGVSGNVLEDGTVKIGTAYRPKVEK
ncbi:MAG: hypothetical protein ACLPSF_01970 [Methylocella sp.]